MKTALYLRSVEPLDELIIKGDYEKALGIICNTCSSMVSNKDFKFQFNQIPQLDTAVQAIGEKLYEARKDIFGQTRPILPVNVFIATELYQVGGHTRVLEEIVDNAKLPSIIILTDLFNNYSNGKLKLGRLFGRLSKTSVFVLPSGTYVEKIKSLHNFIVNTNPKTIGIVAHHQDVVAYAACNAKLQPKQVYIHHADINPTLGPSVRHYVHLDLSLPDFLLCKEAGFVEPMYLPMSMPKNFKDFFKSTFSTATSGSFDKFLRTGPLSYCQIVKAILQTIEGVHYHIGPIPQDYLQEIQSFLITVGVDPGRFVYIGPVENVISTLQQYDIDVYITSAPTDGARGYIEALSVGLPVVRFVNDDPDERYIQKVYKEKFYSPNHKSWSSTDELKLSLLAIKFEFDAAVSREHFNKYHDPSEYFEGLNNLFG
jgi:hypothetical protein